MMLKKVYLNILKNKNIFDFQQIRIYLQLI